MLDACMRSLRVIFSIFHLFVCVVCHDQRNIRPVEGKSISSIPHCKSKEDYGWFSLVFINRCVEYSQIWNHSKSGNQSFDFSIFLDFKKRLEPLEVVIKISWNQLDAQDVIWAIFFLCFFAGGFFCFCHEASPFVWIFVFSNRKNGDSIIN
jgi:hypothetical protein